MPIYLQHCLTMKSTEDAETATLTTLFHVVRKGSRFLVTGLIRVVFTDASYSGRICSPSSKWLRERSFRATGKAEGLGCYRALFLYWARIGLSKVVR